MMKKICTAILALAAVILMVPIAHASTWDSIKAAGSSLWDTAKEKAAEAADTVREKGPGWVETAKDAAGNAVDTIKENAPGWIESAKEKGGELVDKAGDALHEAQDKVSDWNRSQQDEFWERTEGMVNGGSLNQPTAPATTPAPEITAPPSSAPENITPPSAVPVPTPQPAEAPQTAAPVESRIPEPADVDGHDTIMFYDGHWYREVSEGGELYFNDKMFVRDDSLGENEPQQEVNTEKRAELSVGQIALIAGVSTALSAAIVLPIAYIIARRRH